MPSSALSTRMMVRRPRTVLISASSCMNSSSSLCREGGGRGGLETNRDEGGDWRTAQDGRDKYSERRSKEREG